MASEKRERGEEKGKSGRKRGRGEEKRGRGEENNCAGKGREYFQRCWGRFSIMLCHETFPGTLKNEGKGRKNRKGKKKGENVKKKMRREGKRIFSNVLGKIFFENLPQYLKH